MNRDRLCLIHIREAIEKISTDTAGGRESFLSDPKTQDAVVRNFEIIGEASKRLSDHAKSRCPNVPWRAVAGFRDILIHDYEGVDYVEVWNIVIDHLPHLRKAVDGLLDFR